MEADDMVQPMGNTVDTRSRIDLIRHLAFRRAIMFFWAFNSTMLMACIIDFALLYFGQSHGHTTSLMWYLFSTAFAVTGIIWLLMEVFGRFEKEEDTEKIQRLNRWFFIPPLILLFIAAAIMISPVQLA